MATVRIDKYLWSIRVFKTRSKASEACRSGKVKIKDVAVKPSRDINIDEIITISKDHILRTVKVVAILKNRLSAKLAAEYFVDLTPEEEYLKLRLIKSKEFEIRARGIGRPTKRERREIDRMKDVE